MSDTPSPRRRTLSRSGSLTSMASTEGHAMHLISFVRTDEDDAKKKEGAGSGTGHWVVNEDTAQHLSSFKGNIGVVAVTGAYRTGKSFIVNHVIGKRGAFQVGHTVKSCTRGIWVWSEPLPCTFVDGTEGSCLVLDTEGLHSTDTGEHYDDQLFTLGVLLASSIIYNSVGTINEKSIQKLNFITNLCRTLKAAGDEAKQKGKETTDFTLRFTWLLRDFALKLVDPKGKPISSQKYMEDSLAKRKGFSPAINSRNRTTAMLRDAFPVRSCVTLVIPAADEATLQRMGDPSMPLDKLRPQFLKQAEAFRKDLFKNLPPKTVAGAAVSAPGLVAMARAYCTAINAGGVPSIMDAWGSALSAQCARAGDEAVAAFRRDVDAITAALPLEAEALRNRRDAAKDAALGDFDDAVPSRGAISNKCRDAAATEMADVGRALEEANDTASKTQCEAVFEELYQAHIVPIRAQVDSAEALLEARADAGEAASTDKERPKPHEELMSLLFEAYQQLRAGYLPRAVGPAKSSVLEVKGLEKIRPITEQLIESQGRCVVAAKEQLGISERAVQAIQGDVANLRREVEAVTEQQVKTAADLTSTQAELGEAATARDAAQANVLSQKLELDRAQKAKEDALSALKTSEEQLKVAQGIEAEWRAKHADAVAEAEAAREKARGMAKERAEIQSRQDGLTGLIGVLRADMGELRTQASTMQSALQDEAATLARQCGDQIADVLARHKRKLGTAAEEGTAKDAELEEAQKKIQELEDRVMSERISAQRAEATREDTDGDRAATKKLLEEEMTSRLRTQGKLDRLVAAIKAGDDRTAKRIAAGVATSSSSSSSSSSASADATAAVAAARGLEQKEAFGDDKAGAGAGAASVKRPMRLKAGHHRRFSAFELGSDTERKLREVWIKFDKVSSAKHTLEAKLAVLQGAAMTKFSFKNAKSAERYVLVDPENGLVGWAKGNKRKKMSTKVRLKDVTGVYFGYKSPTLLSAATDRAEYKCFSFEVASRTYDFIAEDSRIAMHFVLGLQQFTTARDKQRVRWTYGKLLWRWLQMKLPDIVGRKRESTKGMLARMFSEKTLEKRKENGGGGE